MTATTPHILRTANQFRQPGTLHICKLSRIRTINPAVRLINLSLPYPLVTGSSNFKPGQWVDLHIPGLEQIGGFTVTSSPDAATSSLDPASPHIGLSSDDPAFRKSARDDSEGSSPYIELAIQRSPNPPAKWLWRNEDEILGQHVAIRFGGEFYWPPNVLSRTEGEKGDGALKEKAHGKDFGIKRAVFIAGGVGINPLMSILSYLHAHPSLMPPSIRLLYATRVLSPEPHSVLFLPRLLNLSRHKADAQHRFSLFATGEKLDTSSFENEGMSNPIDLYSRRLNRDDLDDALGPVTGRSGTVTYVCGPQKMTDEIVEYISKCEGMTSERVLCEKWW